jgi:hypothetical protein
MESGYVGIIGRIVYCSACMGTRRKEMNKYRVEYWNSRNELVQQEIDAKDYEWKDVEKGVVEFHQENRSLWMWNVSKIDLVDEK